VITNNGKCKVTPPLSFQFGGGIMNGRLQQNRQIQNLRALPGKDLAESKIATRSFFTAASAQWRRPEGISATCGPRRPRATRNSRTKVTQASTLAALLLAVTCLFAQLHFGG